MLSVLNNYFNDISLTRYDIRLTPHDIFSLRSNMRWYPFLHMPKAYIIARSAISYFFVYLAFGEDTKRYITRSDKERISLQKGLPFGKPFCMVEAIITDLVKTKNQCFRC